MTTFLPLIAAFALLAACSGNDPSPSSASCPQDLPAACPDQVPSYRDDVAPIISSRCFPCHETGNVAADSHDFTHYETVYAQRTTVLTEVYGCVMPPSDAAPLTDEERGTLLAWLVCHAPNN